MEIFFLILIGSLLTAAAIITSVLYLSGDNSPLRVWEIRESHMPPERLILRSRWFWQSEHYYESHSALFRISYHPETKIYKAGCFRGTRDQLAARLNSRERHKLAREFYLNEIARVHSQYPDA